MKRCLKESAFTFHHVSIKTKTEAGKENIQTHSHSTMYLLKRWVSNQDYAAYDNSHSTMYLLKHERIIKSVLDILFTFHHVSIKT